MNARIQTWFPSPSDLSDGREWLARQMDQAESATGGTTTAFSRIDDTGGAQQLMASSARELAHLAGWSSINSTRSMSGSSTLPVTTTGHLSE